jgi:hypothetical protein
MAEAPPFQPLGGPVYEPVPLPPAVGGVVTASPPDQIQDNQLASAANMVIRDGVVTQRKGYETLVGSTGAFSDRALTIFEWIPMNQSALIVMSTRNSLHYYDTAGDAWPLITGTARTGANGNTVFFTPMRTASSGNRLITVNGVDPPAWWDGDTAGAFSYMTTAVIGACATVWRSHFLQGDVTTTADGRVACRVQWSALGDPTTWAGTASTGTIDLQDANGTRIQTFVPLRGNLVAYKEEGSHVMFYKAAPLFFTQTLLHASLTTLSRRSVAPVRNGDQHLVVTKENIILWDGQNIDFIGDTIKTQFFRELNWAARAQVWAIYNPIDDEVMIAVPTEGAVRPNKSWIFSLRYGSWWPCDWGFMTMAVVHNVWSPPKILGGDKATFRVYEVFSGYGDTTDGTPVVSSLQSKLFDFGAPPYNKAVKQVTVLLGVATGAASTITLQQAGNENPVAEVVFDTANQNTVSYAGDGKEPKADLKITRKFWSYRLQHSAMQETVQVHRIIPYVERRETRRKNRS